jgi:ABC-type lipoprotein release transport system permease subunit
MRLSTLCIAWRNLGRNRKRTLLAMGAIALGQFTLVFVNGLLAGSFGQMLDTVTGPMVGDVQVHHPEWREERATDLYIDRVQEVKAQVAALPGVRQVSTRIFSAVLAASGELSEEPADAAMAAIVGVDVATETEKGGLLESLDSGHLPGGRRVVLGRALAAKLGVREGQLVAVIGQDIDGFPVSDLFEVSGVVNSGVEIVKTMGVVMEREEAGELLAMPDQAHEIIVQGDDHETAEDLAAAVAALPALAGDEVLTWREAMPEIARMLGMKWVMDVIFVGILFIAAAAGISNTAMMSTFERTHEFGMLLALGARPRRVVRMVLLESVALGIAGVIIGSALGAGLTLLTGHTGLNYAAFTGTDVEDISMFGVSVSFVVYPIFELRHVLFGLVAVTLTSVIASSWPALLAARLEPVEAMRS